MSPPPPISQPVPVEFVTLRLLDFIFQHDRNCFLYQSWINRKFIDVFLHSSLVADGSGGSDEQRNLIPAHRIVLRAYSNYCEKFFQSYPPSRFTLKNIEMAVPVIVLSVSGDDLQDIVRLMYDGQIRLDIRRLQRLEKSLRTLEMDNVLVVETGNIIPVDIHTNRPSCFNSECFRPYPVIMRSMINRKSSTTINMANDNDDQEEIIPQKAWSEPGTPIGTGSDNDDYWTKRKRRQNTYHAAKYRNRRRKRIEMLFQERDRLEQDQRELQERIEHLESSIRDLILTQTTCNSDGGTVCPRCPVPRLFSDLKTLREHFQLEHHQSCHSKFYHHPF